MADTSELSRAAYERVKAEYDHLTTVWRVEIARKIEAARELGDLKENGDYHAAKDEQGQTEARIRQLQAALEDVAIVDPDGSSVQVNSVVEIKFVSFGDIESYLYGSVYEERDGLDVVSPTSPMGAAMAGAKVGDVVSYEVNGKPLEIEILSIEV